MKDILEFDSLELTFSDKKILSGIYMSCAVGEIVGLLGRNGAGKSSLMKIVFGSLDAGYKNVRISGETLQRNHGKISYLPQEVLIPPHLTIRKAFKLFKISEAHILELYPQFYDFLDLKPAQLSGGYCRLIEAVMVLKSPAQFCILDEPFSGLMPLHIETLCGLMHDMKRKKGIIITDHLYRHVTSISDRLYLLSNGKTYPVKDKEHLVSLGYLNTYE
jgi:ABC-type multidrug transport system ATPase subunit